MKITFCDTETTGLPKHFPDGSGPEITEYCFATWEDGKTSDVVHVLIQPTNAPPPDAEGTCRTPDGFPLSYRPDQWKHAKAKPWSAEDNKLVFSRMHGCYIGGSNPRFDVERFRFEVERFSKGGPRFEHHHRVMDLNALGYPLWVAGLVQSTGLEAARQDQGAAVTPRETALALIEQAADGVRAHATAVPPDTVLLARGVAYLCDAVRDLEREVVELKRRPQFDYRMLSDDGR